MWSWNWLYIKFLLKRRSLNILENTDVQRNQKLLIDAPEYIFGFLQGAVINHVTEFMSYSSHSCQALLPRPLMLAWDRSNFINEFISKCNHFVEKSVGKIVFQVCYSFKKKFIYFWLRWVFVAVRRISLVAASGGYSSLLCAGFSLRWLLLLQSTGCRHADFSSCSAWAQ